MHLHRHIKHTYTHLHIHTHTYPVLSCSPLLGWTLWWFERDSPPGCQTFEYLALSWYPCLCSLGGMGLLEEVYHWDRFWEFKDLHHFEFAFCLPLELSTMLLCHDGDVLPAFWNPDPQISPSFCKFPWSWYFSIVIGKYLRQAPWPKATWKDGVYF